MKKILILSIVLISLQATAQQTTPTPSVDKEMLLMSGKLLEKAGSQRITGFTLVLTSGVFATLASTGVGDPTTTSVSGGNETNPLYVLSAGLGIIGVGLTISSAIQLKRSGAYLTAYANGVVITF